MKRCFIIRGQWLQPEHGGYAFLSSLNEKEQQQITDLLRQINAHMDSGDTVCEYDITPVEENARGGKNFRETVLDLLANSRYEEEGVWDKKIDLLEEYK